MPKGIPHGGRREQNPQRGKPTVCQICGESVEWRRKKAHMKKHEQSLVCDVVDCKLTYKNNAAA